jgi:hypothetical protein
LFDSIVLKVGEISCSVVFKISPQIAKEINCITDESLAVAIMLQDASLAPIANYDVGFFVLLLPLILYGINSLQKMIFGDSDKKTTRQKEYAAKKFQEENLAKIEAKKKAAKKKNNQKSPSNKPLEPNSSGNKQDEIVKPSEKE